MSKPVHASRHCRHYSYERDRRGVLMGGDGGGPLCGLGVDLRSEPGASIPCMPPTLPGEKPSFRLCEPCALREDYMDAERAAWAEWRDESVRRSLRIMALIPPGRSVSGSLACPQCDGGTVRWSRASNGHLHAACSTPDCFAVMQ